MAKGNQMDPELLAMRHIQAILEKLPDSAARNRVLSYVTAKLEDELAQVPLPLLPRTDKQE